MMITFTVPEENGKKVLTMSLDITIKERKEFRCPDCGRLVTTQDINEECSSGRVWYDFLESVGYYVISIHALLAESDSMCIVGISKAKTISIHALLAESDLKSRMP